MGSMKEDVSDCVVDDKERPTLEQNVGVPKESTNRRIGSMLVPS